ncbi:MAG TPA: 16S rRNA (guanine(966)-N(2))-methyltransferase RsmD [Candidatus Binatia bacterium]|nr:16S rRNA (guanine(966)-N(2))-methyltransferase RsmD [Candidatus Binatia bacterium]
MRIVSGSAGGLHLKVPKGHKLRPTADQVKEAIFNILTSRFLLTDITVLDLFAGTGALGIEALSRGARFAVFVDANPEAQRVIRANLNAAGLRRQGRVIRAYVAKGIKVVEEQGLRFGGVFLDPPYGEGWVDKTLRLLARNTILLPGAWVVVEHSQQEVGAEHCPPLALTDRRRYGTTGVSFYQHQGEEAA